MFKQLLCAVFLAASLSAHGGQYRGPGDIVPPGPGGGGRPTGPTTGGPQGPSTGGPAGPSAPIPAGPATGGPGTPGGQPGRGPTTGPRGGRLGLDLTQWSFWWEFNKDPFIRLRDEIHRKGPITGSDEFYLGSTRPKTTATEAPTKEDKLDVLATLRRAMKSTNNRDIITACMIAMAKIGMDHPNFKLKDVFTPHLKSKNQEVRETAALALGIAAQTESDELDILIKLALGKEVK